MNCEQARRWIIDALVEPLEADRAERLRAHLSDCEACAGLAAEYHTLWDALAMAASPEPRPDALERLEAAVKAELDGSREPELDGSGEAEPRAWMPLLRKAASVVLLIGLGAILGSALRPWQQQETVAPAQGDRYLLIMTATNESPDQTDQLRREMGAWFGQLTADGVMETGFRLAEGPPVGTPPDGPLIPPGVTGLMVIRAANAAEARRIAVSSPSIRYGGFVEVHAIN